MAGDNRDSNMNASNLPKDTQPQQDSAFRQHMNRASDIVKNWPAWKQQILGGPATSSQGPPAEPPKRG